MGAWKCARNCIAVQNCTAPHYFCLFARLASAATLARPFANLDARTCSTARSRRGRPAGAGGEHLENSINTASTDGARRTVALLDAPKARFAAALMTAWNADKLGRTLQADDADVVLCLGSSG